MTPLVENRGIIVNVNMRTVAVAVAVAVAVVEAVD
jgi:hypothetical protein